MKLKLTALASALAFVLAIGSYSSALAQDTKTDAHQITVDVPVIALLDLEAAGGVKNFTAAFTQPAALEAGDKLNAPDNNSTLWLNYSSIQTGNTLKRVDVSANPIIPGVTIHLIAAEQVNGQGKLGTPTAGFNLTGAAQALVTGIGSAYTTTGPNNGHQLTYSFQAEDANYADLRSGITPVTVTYTLADI